MVDYWVCLLTMLHPTATAIMVMKLWSRNKGQPDIVFRHDSQSTYQRSTISNLWTKSTNTNHREPTTSHMEPWGSGRPIDIFTNNHQPLWPLRHHDSPGEQQSKKSRKPPKAAAKPPIGKNGGHCFRLGYHRHGNIESPMANDWLMMVVLTNDYGNVTNSYGSFDGIAN